MTYAIFIVNLFLTVSCQEQFNLQVDHQVRPGAYQLDSYISDLKGKKVGLVVNHTSMVDQTHLVDTLLTLGIDIKLIFSPEHGFKGTAYNGEEVGDSKYDEILIKSLYGKTKKPSAEDLERVDVLLFDIQDVGARFYTYIYTLHYVMEAAAESNKPVIILDRPNPNAHYIDGPIMEPDHTSFVGLHPTPVVYGMTIGEYGQMINGEGWMEDGVSCHLKVIPVSNYTHDTEYILPIAPSPNLPNQLSIYLYPSLCFFEGTVISAGRGTHQQFQIYGHPQMDGTHTFTPVSMTSSKYPKHENNECSGRDLTGVLPSFVRAQKKLNLAYLKDAYTSTQLNDEAFFLENGFFEKLAGTSKLRKQIINDTSLPEIRASWEEGISAFRKTRSKYLIYP